MFQNLELEVEGDTCAVHVYTKKACELQSSECCVAVLILLSVLKSLSYVATKINKRDRKRENEQEERREKMRNFCS